MKRIIEKSALPEASELNHEAYKAGCKHYENGNYSKAKQAFKTALEYWPQDPQAWFALGNCHDELNKPNKSEECFRKSLEYTASKEESEVLFNLGNSLFDQNKLTEAVKCYANVSAQSKAYWAAQRNMGLANDTLSNKCT